MSKRRIGAIALTTLLGGAAVAAAPASAVEQNVTEYFGATAKASALHISVLGEDVTLTDTTAELMRDTAKDVQKAFAHAYQQLTPLITTEGQGVSAQVTKKNGTELKDLSNGCTLGQLEVVPGVERVFDPTCPIVSASMKDGFPSASSLGSQLKIDLSVSSLLDSLELRQTVEDAQGTVTETIDPVLGALAEALTGTPAKDLVDDSVETVEDLITDVLGLATTLRLSVGPAVSEVTSTPDTVTAHAKAQGLRIELLPLDNPNAGKYHGILEDLKVGEPLLTIVIAEAEGSQVYDRTTQTLKPATADSALVRVKIGGAGKALLDEQIKPLLDTLGLSELVSTIDGGVKSIPGLESASVAFKDGEFVVKGPGTFTILDGTPLETTIALSAVSADINGFAAAGASLHTLKGVDGGIRAALADIQGAVAEDLTPQPEVLGLSEEPLELARTGTNPTIALVGMALLGLALTARRLTVREEV